MKGAPGIYEEFEEFRGRRFLFAAGHFDYFSGAEKQAVYFAGELVRHLQADVKFIGWGGNGRFADEVRRIGAVPVVFPLHPCGTGWSHYLNLLRLARFIRRELKPDYLLPYVWMHCRVIGAIWEWTGAHFCWWNQRDEGRGISGNRLERRLMKTLPAVISNSFEGRDFLVRCFKLAENRVQVINNGICLPTKQRSGTLRKKLGISNHAVLLLMLANLTRFKDHATLLMAFARARKLCPGADLQLVLAGSHGDATLEIKALAWDLEMGGRLHLPGSVSETDELLADSDLVVHSSTTEGCPNGALEAMAHGLCVLGTNISGMRQALGADVASRCLAKAGDSEELAGLIANFVQNPDRRAVVGKLNLERIKSCFSIQRMTSESLAAIRDGSAT